MSSNENADAGRAPIRFRNLTKDFGRNRAVDELTFDVPEGEVLAFLGPNGAGKTTTIQTLMNLHRPTSGAIEVLGVDSRKLGPEQLRRIGYVSENMELPLWMTVDRFMNYCRPFYPTWDDTFAKQLLDEFQLPRDRKLKHLSRGMRMKAALVGGIAYRPKLVVLDEPFSGLDPLVRDEFIRGLLALTGEEGWTVFLSSHDIDEVERLADRVAVIDSGSLRLNQPIGELLDGARRVEVVCESEPENLDPPTEWLDFRQAGRSLSFAVSDFTADDAALKQSVRSKIPGITRIAISEMSLREVFVAMAQKFRLEGGLVAK